MNGGDLPLLEHQTPRQPLVVNAQVEHEQAGVVPAAPRGEPVDQPEALAQQRQAELLTDLPRKRPRW